ncbi:MAG: hypothetical protein AABX29_06430 [Nanoarchaeota archaeon]
MGFQIVRNYDLEANMDSEGEGYRGTNIGDTHYIFNQIDLLAGNGSDKPIGEVERVLKLVSYNKETGTAKTVEVRDREVIRKALEQLRRDITDENLELEERL